MNARLHEICTRIARLEADRKASADEISEIKKTAKEEGYDTALIGKTVRLMNMKPGKRQAALEQHELFDTYLSAAGLLPEFEPAEQPAPEAERGAIKRMAKRLEMEDAARMSKEMADKGLISMEDAEETRQMCEAINKKWGDGKPILWADPAICVGIAETIPPHDAATGEITDETPAASCLSGAGQEGGALDHLAPPSNDDPGEVPGFLDRRRRREETDMEFPVLGEAATW
jgi:uncharacterized protein (UPF0335 family)